MVAHLGTDIVGKGAVDIDVGPADRRARGGAAASTRVPALRLRLTSPDACNSCIAARTVERLTANCSASLNSVGSTEPTGCRPSAIASVSARATKAYRFSAVATKTPES